MNSLPNKYNKMYIFPYKVLKVRKVNKQCVNIYFLCINPISVMGGKMLTLSINRKSADLVRH